jgi:uncharacterized membrane protein
MVSGRDMAMVSVLLLLLGTVGLAVHLTMTEMVDKFVSLPAVNDSSGAVSAWESAEGQLNRLDYINLVIFIAVALTFVITGYFIGANTVFAVLYFIVMVVSIILTSFTNYIWDALSGTSYFVTITANHYPITNHLISNGGFYVTIVMILGFVAMFTGARKRI